MNGPSPIASRRHLAIVLAILSAVTFAGVQQAASRSSTDATSPSSRLALYAVLIGLQLVWVRYVASGMKRQGHSVTELIGRSWTTKTIAVDVAMGAAGYAAAALVTSALKLTLGDRANTAFLLPHGLAESGAWVMLSVTAGICEELVFRGYLQRQFAALTGSLAAGIVLQAALFGISHGYQGLSSIATTGAYGLTMGALAAARGNVRACAIAHVATDLVGGLWR